VNHQHSPVLATSTPLLQLQGIAYAPENREILRDVSLELHSGQILTVIGPNGAGKTTLIKIAMGLVSPSAGSVQRVPGLRIGYMPQRLQVEATMPIQVERFLRLGPAAQSQRLREALEEVGAPHVLKSSLNTLSGGELQRVLLARALLHEPQLLVLDEPTQGVDLKGQAELYRLITRIRDRHQCAVLMVSHDLHLVMSSTDEVICLNQHVCCHGHPEQVSNDPAYLELFGKRNVEAVALYTHHHNHHHDLTGCVVKEHKHEHP
jgi:ABC-type Mn/Zn transport systems, ATPase component